MKMFPKLKFISNGIIIGFEDKTKMSAHLNKIPSVCSNLNPRLVSSITIFWKHLKIHICKVEKEFCAENNLDEFFKFCDEVF